MQWLYCCSLIIAFQANVPSSSAPLFSSDAKRANLLRLKSVCRGKEGFFSNVYLLYYIFLLLVFFFFKKKTEQIIQGVVVYSLLWIHNTS